MNRISLSTLEREQDLRKVWEDEAKDFTPWLAEPENLSLLGDAIGTSLTLEEIESSVGDFNVDILCRQDETDYKVIIENQLEMTDNKHLGQIMTYAAGKDARIVIWVVKKARTEHRKAVEWLNDLLSTNEKDVQFFLVEVELWKIGDSGYAPHFTVVERPNNWTDQIVTKNNKTDKKIARQFWEKFVEIAPSIPSFKESGFKARSVPRQYYYNLTIGRSYMGVVLSFSTYYKRVAAGLYFKNCRELYEQFKEKADDIHKALEESVDWNEGQKDCTLRIFRSCDPDDQTGWDTDIKWLCKQATRLKQIADRYDKK